MTRKYRIKTADGRSKVYRTKSALEAVRAFCDDASMPNATWITVEVLASGELWRIKPLIEDGVFGPKTWKWVLPEEPEQAARA